MVTPVIVLITRSVTESPMTTGLFDLLPMVDAELKSPTEERMPVAGFQSQVALEGVTPAVAMGLGDWMQFEKAV
ncbi:MAG: hypothetical protein DYH20_13470 [Gammaproteobacteria bacterium PRO9]|nr:hypothetical protein [Gammaproteobacteria bacterium PRO9]